MKVQKNQIKLKTDDWVFKINSEGRRMKIYIKLNQMESSQWSSLKTAAVGPSMSDGEFAKIMLFRGLNSFVDDLNKAVAGMTEEEKARVLSEAAVADVINLEVPSKVDEDAKPEDTNK